MQNKIGQFNFTWLFAIIAGVVILLLAIYGAIMLADTKHHQADTEVGKTLDIITDPMQAGWAQGRYGKIEFKQATRINNFCVDNEFGKNELSVSTESGVGKAWKEAGGATSIYDKYIFSTTEEGEDYYIFSKAFEFPYKVSDLIFMTSRRYCFVDAPEEIKDDIQGVGAKNLEIENCSSSAVRVCFERDCDITVNGDEESGVVVKNGLGFEYVGNLLYGAVVADKAVYDCNVKRLLYRAGTIADVYIAAGRAREARGVGTNLVPHLTVFQGFLMNATASDLASLQGVAEDIDKVNDKEVAGLW